jgi:aminoglycoside 3-N-acetyltransferase
MEWEQMNSVLQKKQLIDDLRKLGVSAAMEILVHSSLSSIGHVVGGAETVIDALLEAVDHTLGTVIVPTLTGTADDGLHHPPYFHVKDSKCWTGAIPEAFRLRQEAHRSLNPTHSVAAIGANAIALTTGHEDCWTTCGYGSPYYRNCRRNGKILLLGVTLDSNTTFHTAEEVSGVKYHLQSQSVECTIIDELGRDLKRQTMLHDWATPRDFSRMEEVFLNEGIMVSGWIGKAKSYLIDAKRMLEFTCGKLNKSPRLLVKY